MSTSCKKDDDTPKKTTTTDNTLTGVWQIEQLFIGGVDAADDCYKKTTFNIKADNTLTSTNYLTKNDVCSKSEAKGTWKAEGDKLTITDSVEDGGTTTTYTYSINTENLLWKEKGIILAIKLYSKKHSITDSFLNVFVFVSPNLSDQMGG
ncbi:MAG: lipocalin family protein [Bacteroidetes bacterium]|nr:lipocalin family protein [Bacteroidota bacterium]MDA0888045.1 lipocalin family protein [Bacteroidota bacterium]MDA1083998.1 lipocalin family protein [Bacteroidota bacterium]